MPRLRFEALALVALALTAFATACSASPNAAAKAPKNEALYDPKALPTGAVGQEIAFGHDIIVNPQKLLPNNVRARITCEQCHLKGGTVDRGGTFAGVYARFPQWNKRAKRVIMLQDRIAECFLYSENGTPPSYASKEMVAIASYIAYLSRNVPIGAAQDRKASFLVAVPFSPPDTKRGATLYATKCAACHQSNGAGSATIPPLWGPASFNSGAGMAHIDRMAGFIRYNMPANAPGSLSLEESYAIAAWVLAQPRPTFDAKRLVTQAPSAANYF